MPTTKIIYLGNLRTQAQHLASSNTLLTDAPLDNNGKGETFSPTDLASTSLVNCMMTIMGILAERENIDLSSLEAEMTKEMESNPRRIKAIKVHFQCPGLQASDKQIQMLKNAAVKCPVALSLHPDIQQEISWDF